MNTYLNNLPESWDQVNLRQYKALLSIPTGLTSSEQTQTAYQILTNDNTDLSLEQLSQVNTKIEKLKSSPLAEDVEFEILVAGEKYYLEYDLSRIKGSVGSWIEKALSQAEGNYYEALEYIMAGIYGTKVQEPITKKKNKILSLPLFKKKQKVQVLNYELENILDRHEFYKRAEFFLNNMNAKQVQSGLLFFCAIALKYLQTMTSSLIQNQTRMRQDLQDTSQITTEYSAGTI